MATISASPELVSPRPAAWIRTRLPQCLEPPAGSSPAPAAPLAVPKQLPLLLTSVFVLTLVLFAVLPRLMSATRPAGLPAAIDAPAESAAHPAWTVQGGQTLWSIAATVAPDVDPRRTVQRIRELNALPTGHVLQVGEVLLLPTSR